MSKQDLETKLRNFNSSKLIKWLAWIFTVASISIACVFWFYLINFSGGLSNKTENWGAFGDFVGGTLNPILSFMALIALLLTIILQSRELEATREELSRSATAQEKQVKYIAGQLQRDDLIRLVTKLTDRINNNYNLNILDGGISINAALIGSASCLENDDLYLLTEQMGDLESRTFKLVRYLETDLINLFKILEQYDSVSSDISNIPSPFKLFYINEYSELVSRFTDYGWFKVELRQIYCC